jgi:four helix bundle protein
LRDFRKYEVWQLSHPFVLNIYKITQHYPKHELFGITSQMRRAAASIPTNISEGCGRGSDDDFARFLTMALGSAHEIEYLLQLSFDLNYLLESIYKELDERINLIKMKLFHLHKTITNNGKDKN